jgi:GNAT superfamily N-acetyltransferase
VASIQVRPFEERDRPALQAIYRDCREEAAWLPVTVKERSDFSRDTEGETILVAVGPDDEPQGFISAWQRDGFIHHLYVRSCSRRKRIGQALLDALGARMPKPWRLKCLRANLEAMAFYAAQGWNEISSGANEEGTFALLERAEAIRHSTVEGLLIDEDLARRIVATQFPKWADLPIRSISQGWDNRTFRLGDDMLIRMPSAAHYAAQVAKENYWLPKLAPSLPLRIPTPLAVGTPASGYPWHWSIYGWIEGETAAPERGDDMAALADSLARFLSALHEIDAAKGPSPGPHNFYRGASPAVMTWRRGKRSPFCRERLTAIRQSSSGKLHLQLSGLVRRCGSMAMSAPETFWSNEAN